MRKSKRFFVVIGLTVAIFFLARYTFRPNSSSRSSDELAWHDPPKATREVPTAVNLLAPEILNIRAPSSAYSQPTKAGSLLAVQAWKEASQTWEGLALPTSIDNRGSSPIRLRLSLEEAILPQEIGWLDIRFLVNGGRNARIQSFGTRGSERTPGNGFRFPTRGRRDRYRISGNGFYGSMPIVDFELVFDDETSRIIVREARLLHHRDTLPQDAAVLRHAVGGEFRDALYLRNGGVAEADLSFTKDNRLTFALASMGNTAVRISVVDKTSEDRVLFETSEFHPEVWREESLDFTASHSGRGVLRFEATGSNSNGGVFIASPVVGERVARDPRPNVIFLVVDTLRATQLGTYGYARRPTSPFIDELASDGTVFERCFAAGTATYVAVPSLLTGSLPEVIGVNDPGERVPTSIVTLAEVFGRAGYVTASVVASAYAGRFVGLDRGFSSTTENFAFERKSAEELLGRAADLIDRSRARPFFLYIHLIDPHDPYVPPDGYLEAVGFKGGSSDPDDETLYDAEVRYVDESLRQFMDRVQRLHGSNLLLVLSSDHGEMLGERGLQYHVEHPYQQVLHIPLIFHSPGQGVLPRRIASPVHAVDIAPTILRLVGLTIPETMDGMDLTRPETLRRNRLLHSAWPTTLIQWPYKYIADDGKIGQLLFNLERDPWERKDLSSLEPEIVAEMRKAWRKESRRLAQKRRKLAPEGADTLLIDPESMRLLQSLGYID